MSFDFTGRTALVTGASRGVGLGVSEACAAAGATLHVLARDPVVHAVAKRLGATGRTFGDDRGEVTW